MKLGRRQVLAVPVLAGISAGSSPPVARAAAAAPPPLPAFDSLIGGVSSNWAWFDECVGPVQVYRTFDGGGFHYPTWQDTVAHRLHPNAPGNDYSFEIPPQELADPASGAQQRVADFLRTTPLNLQVTNFHEPDNKFSGRFTPAQHRAATVALAALVRAQNARDGGRRRTSVILMNITFGTYGRSRAVDWWPTDERDGGHADIVSVDAYALPHATKTAGIPAGYTDGLKWKSAQALLTNVYTFAATRQIPWSISELGYLEDVHDPRRKAEALTQVVAWARSHGAQHVSYFDANGPRADWRLRHSAPPIPSQSTSSNAARAWASLAAPA